MRRWLILIAVVTGLMMDIMDLTIVNVAVPAIMTGFGTDLRLAQYVITAYMITIGLFEPITAFLADTRGTKRTYLISLAVFTFGSVLCATAWDVTSLILFRVIQAIGGAMIMPLALSIVQKTFSKREFPIAMAVMGIPLLLAPALGPTVGGYLVEYWNWRFIFWLNVPVGIVAMVASYGLLNEFETTSKRLDLPGFVLSAVGFSTLLLAVSNGASDGWGSLEIVLLFWVSAASLSLFVIFESGASEPLLDLRVFKNRSYIASTGVTFFMMMSMFGSLFLVPLFMQSLRGLGAMQTGGLFLPEVLGASLALPLSGLLLSRLGPIPLTAAGFAVMAIGMYPFHSMQLATNLSDIRLHLFIVGAGLGLGLMPPITTAFAALPKPLVNQGSAFLNMMRQVGSAVGVAILTSVIQQRTPVYVQQLGAAVTPESPMGRFLAGLAARFHEGGFLPAQAHRMALAEVVRIVDRRAGVMAFHDAFLVSILLGAVAVIPLVFLVRRKTADAAVPELVSSGSLTPQRTDGD